MAILTLQFCARRLAASAMAIAYGRTVAWRSPSFSSQRASVAVAASANLVTNAAASLPSVTVNLRDVSIAGVRDGPTRTTYYQLPTTNYQLPTTNYRLPTTDYRLLTTD